VVREDTPWLEVEQTICDLATVDRDELATRCRGADAIVHLAGDNEAVTARDLSGALSSTVTASMRVADAARRADVPRIVYLSTVHVYGAQMTPGVTLTEDMRPDPRSGYAVARLASEHVIAGLGEGAYDLVVLRLTNSVGAPRDPCVDRWSLVTNDLARQGALTGRLTLRSTGVQWRDFLSLADVCSAIGAACAVGAPALTAGTYNLGSGVPRTVLEVVGLVQDAFERRTGSRPPLEAPAPGPEEERDRPYRVSVQRLADGGVTATAPLADAVDETVAFCVTHRKEL
jgi:UDP-glucose 4-epimerase